MAGIFDKFREKIEVKKTKDQEIAEALSQLDAKQTFRIELVADQLNQLVESDPSCSEAIANKLKERAKIELRECADGVNSQNNPEEIGHRLQTLFYSLDTLISDDDAADDVDKRIKRYIQNEVEFKKFIYESLPADMESDLRMKFEKLLA